MTNDSTNEIQALREILNQAHSDATDLMASIKSIDKLCIVPGEPTVPFTFEDLHGLIELIEGKARVVLDTLT